MNLLEKESKLLHKKTLLAELHSDYPVDLIRRKRSGEENVLRRIWFPKIAEGGVDVSNFIVGGDTLASGKTVEDVLEAISYLDSEISLDKQIEISTTVNEIRDNFSKGKTSIILGLEGVTPIGTKVTNLQVFYKLGLRIAQLTWNGRNMAADGFAESRTGGGLTHFGVELVKEMNRLGIMIDMSHLSPQGVSDVLQTSRDPVICSHSNCLSLCNHPRNIDDETIKKIADKGGLVGVAFYPKYLRNDWQHTSLDDVITHIDYLKSLVGEDYIGLGPDFIHFSPELIHESPIPNYPEGLQEVDQLPNLTVELVKRGYTETSIEKIFGANFLRVAEEIWGE